MTGRGAHRIATLVLSLLMAAIGVGLIAEAAAASGNVLTLAILGVLFLAAGAGRIFLELRRGRGP